MAASCLLLLALCVYSVQSFRAAWIPSSYKVSSSAALCSQMAALQSVGFDRVYLDVFNNGVVYFNSSTVHNAGLGGAAGVLGDDRLRWATECATSDQFSGEVFAWFEYGLMAQYGESPTLPFARYAQQQGWVLGASGGFLWLNAASGATDFLASMLADVAHSYPNCHGVQLDDHFAQPVELRQQREQREQLARPPGSAPDQTTSRAVRSGVAMTAAARVVSTAVRRAAAARATPMTLSLAPATLSQALHSFDVDWASWATAGLFDEFVPQLYRSSYADFAPLLNASLAAVGTRLSAVGLRADGSGAPTPFAELEQMYAATEHAHHLSSSLWYAHAALELYPKELAAYFSGKKT